MSGGTERQQLAKLFRLQDKDHGKTMDRPAMIFYCALEFAKAANFND
jgi:hypothetical protein